MQNERPADDARLTLLYSLALAVAVTSSKVLPRYAFDPLDNLTWNIVPMGALALFVGSRLRSSYAYLVPLLAMLVADLLLIPPLQKVGFSSITPVTPWVYLSFAVYVLIGRAVQKGELSPVVIGGGALVGSLQFFLVTNFGVWLNSDPAVFARSFEGLMACYSVALPFYRNTLTSDLFFSAVFFAGHAALARGLAWRKARQAA